MAQGEIQHTKGHMLDMAWSYATDWIRAVHMFQYRLVEELPEDKLFFSDTVGIRQEIDFNCYLTAMLRLQRAITMACEVWKDGSTKQLEDAIEKFKIDNPSHSPRNYNAFFQPR